MIHWFTDSFSGLNSFVSNWFGKCFLNVTISWRLFCRLLIEKTPTLSAAKSAMEQLVILYNFMADQRDLLIPSLDNKSHRATPCEFLQSGFSKEPLSVALETSSWRYDLNMTSIPGSPTIEQHQNQWMTKWAQKHLKLRYHGQIAGQRIGVQEIQSVIFFVPTFLNKGKQDKIR